MSHLGYGRDLITAPFDVETAGGMEIFVWVDLYAVISIFVLVQYFLSL